MVESGGLVGLLHIVVSSYLCVSAATDIRL